MERYHGLVLACGPAAPLEATEGAIRDSGHQAESQEYPYELKGVYDQIPDVVASRRDALAPGNIRLVPDLRQQPFRLVRTGRREDHGHHRAGSFGHCT